MRPRYVTSLPRFLEMTQIGCRLTFAHRHQQTVGTEEIHFLTDGDIRVVLLTVEFPPSRSRVRVAAEIPGYDPWPGQGMVDHRDLVMQNVLIVLVEKDAFLEDR